MALHDLKFTDDALIEQLKLGLDTKQCAEKLGVHPSNVYRRVAKLAEKGYSPTHKWDNVVPDGYKIRGMSDLVDASGNVLRRWVKSEVDKDRQIEMIHQTIESFTKAIPRVSKSLIEPEASFQKHLLAVLPIGDPHIGMRAWREECGAEWNLKVAVKTFCDLFNVLIDAAPKCDKVVIECLGDLLHADNMAGTTSRSGHHLDMAGSYAEMVDAVILVIRFVITKCLSHFNNVEVKFAIGNHDDVGSIWVARLFQAAFENESRVQVDVSSGPCLYTRFGNNLIGVHHGHTIKMHSLPGIMATDRRKDWGDTEFQYWHTGHIHHDSTFSAKEFPSCKVESFRTLAPKDSYATWGGWRSGQDSKCIIYHEKYGEVSRITKNIAEILE